MNKITSLLIIFLLITISIIQTSRIVNATDIDLGEGSRPSNIFKSLNSLQEIDDFLETLENLGRVAELGAEQIAPYIFELSDKGLSQLSAEQLEYEDSSGIRTINKIDDWNKLNKAARGEALSDITGREISTDNEYT